MWKLSIIWLISIFISTSQVQGKVPCNEVFDKNEFVIARAAALERHNLYRCMHNAPPLDQDNEVSYAILS